MLLPLPPSHTGLLMAPRAGCAAVVEKNLPMPTRIGGGFINEVYSLTE